MPDDEITRYVQELDRVGMYDALTAVHRVVEAAPPEWFSDVAVQSAAMNVVQALELKLKDAGS